MVFEYRDQSEIKWKIYQFVALSFLYRMVYKRIGITQKMYWNTFKICDIMYKENHVPYKGNAIDDPNLFWKKKVYIWKDAELNALSNGC